MGEPRSQSWVEVELAFWAKFEVGVHSKVPLSVPQMSVPSALVFTSQLAALRVETMRLVVEAVVKVKEVVEA